MLDIKWEVEISLVVLITVVKIKMLYYPYCDVSCISLIIQDGGHLKCSRQNIPRTIKIRKSGKKLLLFILKVLLNESN